MPSILNDDDKDTVKRFVPKQTNKIQAVAVARLYVAYPNRSRWTYTGLQGAVVLSNDLVGNTYWLKMVDISPSSRGVIWDQELFDTWNYNQDRTFFHTFELPECLAALSFVDEKEAKQFKKKMDEREKNASRATKSTPFGGGSQPAHKHGLLGGLFGHRSSSNTGPPEAQRSNLPPPPPPPPPTSSTLSFLSEFALLDAFDPLWRDHFGQDLRDKGLTDDFIKDNQEFIVDFLRDEQQNLADNAAVATSQSSMNDIDTRNVRAPPPPPPPANGHSPSSSQSARRNGPPPPPAPRRTGKADVRDSSPPRDPSPASSPPPPPRPRFNAPPPLADAGKFAHVAPELKKTRPTPAAPSPGPPPPPRPGKTAVEPDNSQHKFGVPPAFSGQRAVPPPPTPNRGPVPPPPPPRNIGNDSHVAIMSAPPPLPPKVPASIAPLPPSTARPVPPPPTASGGPPLPPPLPPTSSSSGPPPPPPLPPPSSSGGPPPPPPPPPPSNGPPAPALPQAGGTRSAMLGDIQKAGGIGALKKVDRTQIRDRSEAQVGGSGASGGGGSGPPVGAAPVGAGGGMADALAAALEKRKGKVSRSDDESDNDDW